MELDDPAKLLEGTGKIAPPPQAQEQADFESAALKSLFKGAIARRGKLAQNSKK